MFKYIWLFFRWLVAFFRNLAGQEKRAEQEKAAAIDTETEPVVEKEILPEAVQETKPLVLFNQGHLMKKK